MIANIQYKRLQHCKSMVRGYGLQNKLQNGSALTLLTVWCKHYTFCLVLRRGLYPRVLSLSHQTGNKGFSWLRHSASWMGFQLLEAMSEWSDRIRWNPAQRQKLRAAVSHKVFTKHSSTSPSPQPLPLPRAQQTGSSSGEEKNGSWHR